MCTMNMTYRNRKYAVAGYNFGRCMCVLCGSCSARCEVCSGGVWCSRRCSSRTTTPSTTAKISASALVPSSCAACSVPRRRTRCQRRKTRPPELLNGISFLSFCNPRPLFGLTLSSSSQVQQTIVMHAPNSLHSPQKSNQSSAPWPLPNRTTTHPASARATQTSIDAVQYFRMTRVMIFAVRFEDRLSGARERCCLEEAVVLFFPGVAQLKKNCRHQLSVTSIYLRVHLYP